jgi:CheY-like chemotaxis protein
MSHASLPLVLLVAGPSGQDLCSALESRYTVVHVHHGAQLRDWALEMRPELVVVASQLPDMSGIDACRAMHGDLRFGHHTPTLIVTPAQPTAEQRVAALAAEVWDFLRFPGPVDELLLKLAAYVQAKRNIDLALAEGLVDPTTGLHSRPGLARRARELGALMSRNHGALSCLVFSMEGDGAQAKLPGLVAHSTRASDVVGALNASMFAVLAPGTAQAGAVQLARRLTSALLAWRGAGDSPNDLRWLRVGYEAVANLTYAPIDPVELLARAVSAVRDGTPDPTYVWLRRYAATSARNSGDYALPGAISGVATA